jgi:uncharacterized protein YbjT (DUF2867 family)
VGHEILATLLADKSCLTVHTVGRRKLSLDHPKLAQHLIDFKNLGRLPKADEVYIALGTTIKVAGSQSAFRAIDFDAVVAIAQAARALGATKLGIVSAMGANPASRIFYCRIKGEAEQALATMGFKTLVIARPAMLAGDREALNQPGRLGEHIGLAISSLLKPLIAPNYRSIAARDVAHALVQAVQSDQTGTTLLLSDDLQGA